MPIDRESVGQAIGLYKQAIKLDPQFALANKGHDTRALQAYLGHKNIQHTVRYTELSSDRFKDFLSIGIGMGPLIGIQKGPL